MLELNKLYNGNCLEVLKNIYDNSIDCIVTDPPYGYSFMNKDWDKAVVSVDIWKECFRVLKWGAFAAVMSSPRQDVLSRMIVNLQDVGFRTDFTSIYWTYASGFPKAANVSKLVDKRQGLKGEVIGQGKGHTGERVRNHEGVHDDDGYEWKGNFNITKPASKEAQTLDGSYAGFQPKPAVEVILMVMKPLSEKSYVDQALSNGKGITWLDSCRIPFQDEKDFEFTSNKANSPLAHTEMLYKGGWKDRPTVHANNQGRFPANLLVSDDVLNDGVVRKSNGHFSKHAGTLTEWNCYGKYKPLERKEQHLNDSGSFSRFFDLDKWFDTTFPFIAVPKASSSEKNKGLDKWISKVNDGRQTPIDNPFQRGETVIKNIHPTVKPVKLMSWLISLLTRPNETVLDPFSGSGTTCLAAQMLNRNYIGIELNKEYIEIAEQRLKRQGQ